MNAAQYEEMLSLLQDIVARLDRLEGRLGALESAASTAAVAAPVPHAVHADPSLEGAVADDRDLDGQYGNPEIKKDPPRWSGPSFVGMRFSDATPDYLDTLAGFLDWKARESDKKNETLKNGAPRSKFIRLDAARARGWRRRILEKNGKAARPAAPKPAAEEFDADMPF